MPIVIDNRHPNHEPPLITQEEEEREREGREKGGRRGGGVKILPSLPLLSKMMKNINNVS